MKELECDEPYEVSPGCPTVTFELADGPLMLPWSSFASGILREGRIELNFQEWRVEIEGRNLGEVWKLLQMQDLRVIRVSAQEGRMNGGSWINRIFARKVGGEDGVP